MELFSLIPNNNDKWSVGKFLYFHKLEKIPVALSQGEVVYVSLDNRIPKQVIQLVQKLIKEKIKFYFTTPEIFNPKGLEDWKNKVILHYLYSYAQPHFYNGFKKINFDLIHNLVVWTEKEDCFDCLKGNYEKSLEIVNSIEYDYYSSSQSYDYPEEIREEFRTLYREIIINRIL